MHVMHRGTSFTARALVAASLFTTAACGGGSSTPGANEPRRNEWGDIVTETTDPLLDPAPFDPKAFVRAYAAPRHRVFWGIEGTEQELSRAARTTRDREAKRQAQLQLLRFRFQAAERATEASQRTAILRTMAREERTLLRGNTDPALAAEVAFMHVWIAWVSGDYTARSLADAFVTAHTADVELARVVQIIRAEMAFSQHEVANARDQYAALRGDASDGLTAYAGYRASRLLCLDGQIEPCRRGLEEVRLLACAPNASDASREFGGRAARELGRDEAVRRDRPDGVASHCSAADVAAATPSP